MRSDWFYAPENTGNKIKSPIELWVGIRRALPLESDNPEMQLLLQKALGQVLFFPPSVAGWPGGKNWIDSSSLMLRLRIPQLLYLQSDLDLDTKDDDDQLMGQAPNAGGTKGFSVAIDWAPVAGMFGKIPEKDLVPKLADYLWAAPANKTALETVHQYADRINRDTFLKTAMIQLMATPEYQLC